MKLRLFFSLGALSFGLVVLLISLFSVAAPSLAESENLTERQLYMGEMLPDHVLYPALMLLDRAALNAASPAERVTMQIEYANRRYYYVLQLLAKHDVQLAETTFTKSIKYVIQAAEEARSLNNPTLDVLVLRSLQYYQQQIVLNNEQFPDELRKSLGSLKDQLHVFEVEFTQQRVPR